jgi:hypothetical protein
MKCLKCDKKATTGNYCEEHEPKIPPEMSEIPRGEYEKREKAPKQDS